MSKSPRPNQIKTWRAQSVERAAGVFGSGSAAENAEPAFDVKTLHAKIDGRGRSPTGITPHIGI